MRTALIAGASGLVGGECLKRLLADPDYERVVAIVRKPLPAHPKLESKVVDFAQLSALDPFPVTDVFCALGTTIKKAGSQEAFRKVDFEYPKAFAEFGKQCGAATLALVSSVGADTASSYFYLRVKGETESALAAMGFASTSIFRPGFLLGNRTENRPLERFASPFSKAIGFLLVGGLRKYRAIEGATVGHAMVAAAKRGAPGTDIYEFDEIVTLSTV